MANHGYHTMKTPPRGFEISRIIGESYRRAVAGLPMPRAYETASRAEQLNCEVVRYWVTLQRANGLQPAPWSPSAKGIPDKLRKVIGTVPTIANEESLGALRQRLPDESLAFTRPHLNRRGFPNPIPTYCVK